jgi:hypothetical protein
VEKGLKEAFGLAERWQALLLLDEADVYLEQRRSRNLTHNGIVSGKTVPSHLQLSLLTEVKSFFECLSITMASFS